MWPTFGQYWPLINEKQKTIMDIILCCYKSTKWPQNESKFKICHFGIDRQKNLKIMKQMKFFPYFGNFWHFLLINLKICSKSKSDGEFWIFVNFALILMDSWQKVICLQVLAICQNWATIKFYSMGQCRCFFIVLSFIYP